MDFKAALLKSQPSAATANVFKPSIGDAGTNGKKASVGEPFNASGDEGKSSAVKVGLLISYFPVWLLWRVLMLFIQRMRNRSRRRCFAASIPPPRALFDVNTLPTIIETGPTPPMSSQSPCVESWTYVAPQGRPAVRRAGF